MRTKQTAHLADLAATQAYADRDPGMVAGVELGGVHTAVGVPMLKNNELVGIISIFRQEVRPFSDKQVALLSSFAKQAVIAIENTRLLNELRESLENQTASADILRAIASSPAKAERALDVIAETTARRFGASNVNIRLLDGNTLRYVGSTGPTAEHMQALFPEGPPDANTTSGKAILERRQTYLRGDDVPVLARAAGIVSSVATPLMREGQVIGVLMVLRSDPRPFTDTDLAQLSNFADQAVIAIENARLLNELRESLQQQTATSEVLQVISSSPGELQPVFDAVLANATRICEAKFGTLYLRDGDTFHAASLHNAPPAFAENRKRGLIRPGPGTALGRLLRTKQVVRIADVTMEPAYIEGDPLLVTDVKLAGFRTILAVPMLKENELIGGIVIYRQEVRPFTDKQIELVSNFAKQAVIAIENTRLLNELRESLQQQTATTEVLGIISSSPGELEPVFQAMLENATRICEAKFGNLYLYEDGALRIVASHNVPPAFAEARRRSPFHPPAGGAFGQAIRTKQTAHLFDLAATEPYEKRDPAVVDAVELGGVRTTVVVPMLKDNELIGLIAIFRQEVRPFTDKQIELVANFAAQAVIAIENTRLLNELRESLQQQTATSEVLGVISSSPGELEPVFQAMLANATRLCGAKFGVLEVDDGDGSRIAAVYNVPPALAAIQHTPFRIHPKSGHAEVRRTKQPVHIDDIRAMPPYLEGDPRLVAYADLGGARTTLGVPMFKEDTFVGTIAIYRQEVRPFSAKQIELVKNFAKQAVISIENARLLNELRQRTDDLSEALE
jgi:GAF domain-containing protein